MAKGLRLVGTNAGATLLDLLGNLQKGCLSQICRLEREGGGEVGAWQGGVAHAS